jgi:hypothetical protein
VVWRSRVLRAPQLHARPHKRASDRGATNTGRAAPPSPRARPSCLPQWPRPALPCRGKAGPSARRGARRRTPAAWARRCPDGAGDRVKRPVLELGCLRGAAAHELVDSAAERAAAAAGQRGVSALGGTAAAHVLVAIARAVAILAGAAPLVIARAPAVVPVAITILPVVWCEIFAAAVRAGLILPAIVAACLALIGRLFTARPPLVQRAGGIALAIAIRAVMAAAGVSARGSV